MLDDVDESILPCSVAGLFDDGGPAIPPKGCREGVEARIPPVYNDPVSPWYDICCGWFCADEENEGEDDKGWDIGPVFAKGEEEI